MKKILASLLVLAMCAPAMALTFSTSAAGDTLTINYNLAAGEGLRGLALTVTPVSGDAYLNAAADVSAPAFNTFIDFAADVDNALAYTVGAGHPVALITPDVTAGQYEAAFPATSFALSMGFLDQAAAQAAITTSGAITVKFTKGTTPNATFAVALDTLRGGAVGDALTVDAAGLDNETVVFVTSCRDRLTTTEKALYDRYVTAGKDPSVWCRQFQCLGDADGIEEGSFIKYRIFNADLAILLASWQKKPETGADPRADFNHAEEGSFIKYSVFNADLAQLISKWQKKTSELTNCPLYVP